MLIQGAKGFQFTGNSALHSCLVLNSVINSGKQRGTNDHKNAIASKHSGMTVILNFFNIFLNICIGILNLYIYVI